jgi:hypothetical protein
VLKDKDVYILFYARDDSGGKPYRSEEMATESNEFQTPLQKKTLANGFSETNGTSSSGQKRSFDEDSGTASPPKRPKYTRSLRDVEGRLPQSPQAKEKTPLKLSTNAFVSPAIIKTAGPISSKPFQPLNVQRPSIFTAFIQTPSSKPDMSLPEKNNQFSKDPTQQRSGKPNHKITPLLTTDSNPYADTDPFADGVFIGQQRQSEKQKSHVRPRYPGIGSQLVPGSNRAFTRNEKTLAQRSGLGIEFDKNRARR